MNLNPLAVTPPKTKRRDGLTLIEVLVTTILILIVWNGAFQIFIYTMGLNRTNQNLAWASRDLTTIVEHMISLDQESRRGSLLTPTNFPADWGCADNPPPSPDCSELNPCPAKSLEINSDQYNLIGGKKFGDDTDKETLEYQYLNFDRTIPCASTDIPDPPSGALIVKLSVHWKERGRDISQALTNILRKE